MGPANEFRAITPRIATAGSTSPDARTPMTEDEPHVVPAPEMRRCAVCGAPGFALQPAEAWYCDEHRRHGGERAVPGRHHPNDAMLLGFFLLLAMFALLLLFT